MNAKHIQEKHGNRCVCERDINGGGWGFYLRRRKRFFILAHPILKTCDLFNPIIEKGISLLCEILLVMMYNPIAGYFLTTVFYKTGKWII